MAATTGEAQSKPSITGYVFGGLALAGLLAMSILFFATGLMAPLWALIGFIAIWAILFVLGCIWMIRRHPWRVVLLPVVAAIILLGGLRAGTTLLGWTP